MLTVTLWTESPHPSQPDLPLLELAVQSESAFRDPDNPNPDIAYREIVATVTTAYPHYEIYLTHWRAKSPRPPHPTISFRGHHYLLIRDLRIDYDFYRAPAYLSPDSSPLRLITAELWPAHRPTHELLTQIRQRNQRQVLNCV